VWVGVGVSVRVGVGEAAARGGVYLSSGDEEERIDMKMRERGGWFCE
jgi:hypothetical protein